MDEPTLQVRDGAQVWLIPLTQLLVMVDAARDIAEGAIVARNQEAVATAEAVMRQPHRGQAGVSAYLLQHYMGRAHQRSEAAKTVVAPAQPAQSVAGEASPSAAAETPGAGAPPPGPPAPGGPCQHPPDVACPSCASSYLEARNARKRGGRGARA